MYIDAQSEEFKSLEQEYKLIGKYTHPLKKMERELVGRTAEIQQLTASFARPEVSNVILLGPAGSGKTSIVQGAMVADPQRIYLEVDLPRMIADSPNPDDMAAKLKDLFAQVIAAGWAGKQIVLFIDEFHQIVHLSAAAVEALKPLLADSGTRGLHVVAATTYDEFRKFISSNQALVERLQRLNIPEPDEATCIEILKGMAKRYGVDKVIEDTLYNRIFEYTTRYIPANAQPRKSILLLDAMVGWYRAFNRPLDEKLLADVIYDQEGVNVAFRVDAGTIKSKLDEKVLAQDYATSVIEQRLQLCVADLNDHTKPQLTMLFCGATGTGKTETCKQLATILFGEYTRSLIIMDMTEYANDNALDRFRDELTTRVWERPYSLVMFDEIEKASPAVIRLLLQVLDDGRLNDRNGRETSFVNCYMVLTTNAGSEIYKTIAQYESSDTGSGEFVATYDKLIRRSLTQTTGGNRFPPELLGRIDAIVPFQPLSEKTMERIVYFKLAELYNRVKQVHHVFVDFDKKVIPYIVEDNLSTDSDAGGARRVMSKIESEITCAVARFINNHSDVTRIFVTVEGGMSTENKFTLKSTAHIVVEGRSG